MPGQRSPDVIQVNLRLTKDLHKRLVAAHEEAGRSLNAEMVARLEATFQRERADEILDKAQKAVNEAERIFGRMYSELDKRQGAIRSLQPINALMPSKKKKK